MSVRARWLSVPFLATVLLATPPAAPASPLDIPAAVPKKFRALVRARVHTAKPRRSWESRFKLQTRQGYDLSVVAVDDIVGVIVTRHRGSGPSRKRFRRFGRAASMYVARGTVTTRRIEASFGQFGRIAVRFRPSGRVVKSSRHRRCKGAHRFTTRPGVFAGRIRFTGEQGYVAVRAHRAKGRIRSPLRLRCASSRGVRRSPVKRYARPVGGGPGVSFGALEAGWREALASTEFLALQVGGRTLYFALTEETKGKMAVVRYAMAMAPSRSFVRNEALTAAKLEPPRPFAHAGHYVATPEGIRAWGGNLSVAFPGARVPLAGPRFWVKLESSF